MKTYLKYVINLQNMTICTTFLSASLFIFYVEASEDYLEMYNRIFVFGKEALSLPSPIISICSRGDS